jgi:PadR family transcriptional regulator PadR
MNDNKNVIFGDTLRGYTEKIILSILSNEDLYGYKINKIIESRTNHSLIFNEATLYTTFQRLEKFRYITSYWVKNDNLPKKKYYAITKEGVSFLANCKFEWKRTKELIDLFL